MEGEVLHLQLRFELREGVVVLVMEVDGLDLNKVSAGAGSNSKSGDGFIDRSKVKILLCDNNTKSSEEVLTLLLGCSYQGINLYCFFLRHFC